MYPLGLVLTLTLALLVGFGNTSPWLVIAILSNAFSIMGVLIWMSVKQDGLRGQLILEEKLSRERKENIGVWAPIIQALLDQTGCPATPFGYTEALSKIRRWKDSESHAARLIDALQELHAMLGANGERPAAVILRELKGERDAYRRILDDCALALSLPSGSRYEQIVSKLKRRLTLAPLEREIVYRAATVTGSLLTSDYSVILGRLEQAARKARSYDRLREALGVPESAEPSEVEAALEQLRAWEGAQFAVITQLQGELDKAGIAVPIKKTPKAAPAERLMGPCPSAKTCPSNGACRHSKEHAAGFTCRKPCGYHDGAVCSPAARPNKKA